MLLTEACYCSRLYGTYSRVHKSWNSFFPKILEKPSMVQKKMLHYIKRAGFFTEMKQKKVQNGQLKKFKMAASKKAHFPAPPILNIFSWNFYGLVLGLVELITNPRTNRWKFHEKILRIGRAGKRGFFEAAILNFLSRPFWIFFGSSLWKIQPFYMRYHFFLHYGWFLQNFEKDFIPTLLHTTVLIFGTPSTYNQI